MSLFPFLTGPGPYRDGLADLVFLPLPCTCADVAEARCIHAPHSPVGVTGLVLQLCGAALEVRSLSCALRVGCRRILHVGQGVCGRRGPPPS